MRNDAIATHAAIFVANEVAIFEIELLAAPPGAKSLS
jgi:hypothetical protein